LQWACAVYLDALWWDRLSAILSLILPPLCVLILIYSSDTAGAVMPLLLAFILTSIPALFVSMSCLGAESQANETYIFACLRGTGFNPEQVDDQRPPVLGSILVRVIYYSDIWHYPGRNGLSAIGSYRDKSQAWRIVNGALRAYYRRCREQALAPVRPAEATAVALLWAILAAGAVAQGLILLWLYSEQQPLTPPPFSAICAGLALLDSVILLGLRTDARLGAFLRALQTHLLTQSVLAERETGADAATPPDSGWS
jgi:hypothetical protein